MLSRLAAALTCAVVALALAPSAHAARGLDIGFFDGVFLTPERDPWLQRSADAGADVVRIDIGWVASTRPGQPRDPADPAYDFVAPDAAIKAATARGLKVIASFTSAPPWAEGADRPDDAPPGSWRPDLQALEDYGAALAQRYSGRYPDPAQAGAVLPAVEALQLWNEPNLSKYLTPQWSGERTASPAYYRRMLRAFYRGVRSTGSDVLVATAGTAPFGDPLPRGDRIMPARFVRDLLCLRADGTRLRGTRCPAPAQFDVLAHHPYSVGAPTRSALNADDVSIPDLGRLTRLLRAAERTGRALPRIRHRLWVTEVSYDSKPPDPDGVPALRHAGYLERAFYELWRQGVDTITWFQVRDQPPDPSFAATNQSGVFTNDGTAKPALKAFRFPFVAVRRGTGLRAWGRATAAGTLMIERRTDGGWHTERTVKVSAHETFVTQLDVRGAVSLRARIGADTSLTWRTG